MPNARGFQTEAQNMAEIRAYAFQEYDVLQVTHDDGKRWDDYCSLRNAAEGSQAAYRTVYSRGQGSRFRITRNQRVYLD